MDWTKHAKSQEVKVHTGPRRLPITISLEMQKLIEHFKTKHSGLIFTDTAVLSTFMEAGARMYVDEIKADAIAKAQAASQAAQASIAEAIAESIAT